VGPRAGLDTEVRGKILLPMPVSNPGRPVRSQDTILTEPPRFLLFSLLSKNENDDFT
jgi:hypothetical protein